MKIGRFLSVATAGAVVATAVSCTTVVSVRKVTDKNDATVCGTRYYLPQPFIVARPQSDGSLDVTVEYLPDPTEQYAVCSWSALATHQLSLKLDKGMLSEVNWVADSSAVAAEGVKAAGEVRKTAIEAEVEAAKAQQAKQETATSGLLTAIAAAQVEVAQAQAQYDVIKDSSATEEDKRKALGTLQAAKAKLEMLEQQCTATKCRKAGALSGGNLPLAADVPVGPSRGQFGNYEPARFQVPGPVMFRVAKADGVTLQPVVVDGGSAQSIYEVYSVLPPGSPGGSPTEKIALQVQPNNLGVVQVGPDPKEVKISFSDEFDARMNYAFFDMNAKQVILPPTRPEATRDDSKHMTLKFTNATPPGSYEVRLSLFMLGKPTELLGQVSVPVKVQ